MKIHCMITITVRLIYFLHIKITEAAELVLNDLSIKIARIFYSTLCTNIVFCFLRFFLGTFVL